MNDEIDRDDPLRARFEKAAGAVPSAGPTLLAELKPRMKRARNRRRAALASTSLGVLIVAGAAVALRSPTDSGLDVQSPSPVSSETTSTSSSSTSTTSQPTSTSALATTSTLAATSSSLVTSSTSAASASTAQPATSTSTPPSSTPTSSSTSRSTSTTLGPPIAPRTFSSRGGSVTVSSPGGGTLRIDSVAPLAGWTPTIEQDDRDEVEVRFRRTNPNDEVRLRIRLEDGALTAREE